MKALENLYNEFIKIDKLVGQSLIETLTAYQEAMDDNNLAADDQKRKLLLSAWQQFERLLQRGHRKKRGIFAFFVNPQVTLAESTPLLSLQKELQLASHSLSYRLYHWLQPAYSKKISGIKQVVFDEEDIDACIASIDEPFDVVTVEQAALFYHFIHQHGEQALKIQLQKSDHHVLHERIRANFAFTDTKLKVWDNQIVILPRALSIESKLKRPAFWFRDHNDCHQLIKACSLRFWQLEQTIKQSFDSVAELQHIEQQIVKAKAALGQSKRKGLFALFGHRNRVIAEFEQHYLKQKSAFLESKIDSYDVTTKKLKSLLLAAYPKNHTSLQHDSEYMRLYQLSLALKKSILNDINLGVRVSRPYLKVYQYAKAFSIEASAHCLQANALQSENTLCQQIEIDISRFGQDFNHPTIKALQGILALIRSPELFYKIPDEVNALFCHQSLDACTKPAFLEKLITLIAKNPKINSLSPIFSSITALQPCLAEKMISQEDEHLETTLNTPTTRWLKDALLQLEKQLSKTILNKTQEMRYEALLQRVYDKCYQYYLSEIAIPSERGAIVMTLNALPENPKKAILAKLIDKITFGHSDATDGIAIKEALLAVNETTDIVLSQELQQVIQHKWLSASIKSLVIDALLKKQQELPEDYNLPRFKEIMCQFDISKTAKNEHIVSMSDANKERFFKPQKTSANYSTAYFKMVTEALNITINANEIKETCLQLNDAELILLHQDSLSMPNDHRKTLLNILQNAQRGVENKVLLACLDVLLWVVGEPKQIDPSCFSNQLEAIFINNWIEQAHQTSTTLTI